MNAITAMRYSLALGGISLFGLFAFPALADVGQTSFIRNGEAGFVVTSFSYVLADDANRTGACPHGMSQGYRELFTSSPEGQRREGETAQAYAARVANGVNARATAKNGQNLCMNPELAPGPHPYFHTVEGNVPVWGGINLDGQVSRANGRAAPGTCAHDDFRGVNGERGVDDQFYRVVGCLNSFQSTGVSNEFLTLRQGIWGILITLRGVDNTRNDDNVEIGIYANGDAIQLGANREPLPYATYSMHPDPRFHATARARIVNGVLTSDPFEFRVPWDVATIYIERMLRDARLQLTFTADGGVEGYLAGYTPVVEMYDLVFGYRSGTDPQTGQLHRNRQYYAVQFGAGNGHTCEGAYSALRQFADGHPDANGHCTSISTQYRLKAIPAFVVPPSAAGAAAH